MKFSKFYRGALILALLAISGCTTPRAVSITFGGDVMLARDGAPLFVQDPWGEFARKAAPGKLLFVNLESPLLDPAAETSGQSMGYNLCASAEQAHWLVNGGVSLVTAENNHKSDCGQSGAESDEKILDPLQVSVVGGIYNPMIYEEQGVKVGVIAVDAVTQPLDQMVLSRQVKDLRPNVDILVVSIHWGSEYQAGVDNVRAELAQFLADSGVDVVWGHHPHVLQKVEVLHSGVTGRNTLVMYSMGNLLSDQYMREDTLRSALITATFKNGQLTSVQATPIRLDRISRKLIEPSEQEKQKIFEALNWMDVNEGTITVTQP